MEFTAKNASTLPAKAKEAHHLTKSVVNLELLSQIAAIINSGVLLNWLLFHLCCSFFLSTESLISRRPSLHYIALDQTKSLFT